MTSTAENPPDLSTADVTPDDPLAHQDPTPQEQAGQEPVEVETPSLSAEEIRPIRWVVEAAVGRKAEEVIVLYLAKISDFTDYFMICSGTNERQVQAITDSIVRGLRKHGLRPLHVEGQQQGKWVLIDYGGEMVIHVFLDATRQFYALERLWGDAPNITQQILDSLDGETPPPK